MNLLVVQPKCGSVGVFIVRVWVEGPDPCDLRIRIHSTHDVHGGETRSDVFSSTDQVCRALRRWLDTFQEHPPPRRLADGQ